MTKTKILKYSQQELNIISECVKANPGNINKACQIAQKRIKKELKIERTVNGLQFQYQTKIKPNIRLFQVRGEKSLPANVKNIPTKRETKESQGITQSTLAIDVQMRRSYSPQYKVVMSMINTLSHEEKERLVLETFETL